MESDCVGIVRVPLERLTFSPPSNFNQNTTQRFYSQEQLLRIDWKQVSRLAEIFRRGRCRPSLTEHQMRGTVTPEILEAILRTSSLSKEQLFEKSAKGCYPFINGDFKIWCTQGKRRAVAAKSVYKEKAWWTVRLYCRNPGPYRDFLIMRESEECSHEESYSDGAVARKVRQHLSDGNFEQVRKWFLCLSLSKRKSLSYLLRRLWDGLELGNIHKHLALHCDEQFVNFLGHIYRTWTCIFDGLLHYRGLLDVETVKRLQFLAPSHSTNDEKLVRTWMDQGILFTGITDRTSRQRLLRNILLLRVVIPSIKTLHENMKFFSIGVKILRRYAEVNKRTNDKTRNSLMQNMCADWTQPVEAMIQASEGSYVTVTSPLTAELSFVHMFMSAIREFPRLSDESPLLDRRCRQGERITAFPTQLQLSDFCRDAKAVGFKNEKLEQPVQIPWTSESASISPEICLPPEWRGGKPFTHTFRELQRNLFLPIMSVTHETSAFPRPLFVASDLIRAFFGAFEVPYTSDNVIARTPAGLKFTGLRRLPRNSARPSQRSPVSVLRRVRHRTLRSSPLARETLRQQTLDYTSADPMDFETLLPLGSQTSPTPAETLIPLRLPELVALTSSNADEDMTMGTPPARPHRDPFISVNTEPLPEVQMSAPSQSSGEDTYMGSIPQHSEAAATQASPTSTDAQPGLLQAESGSPTHHSAIQQTPVRPNREPLEPLRLDIDSPTYTPSDTGHREDDTSSIFDTRAGETTAAVQAELNTRESIGSKPITNYNYPSRSSVSETGIMQLNEAWAASPDSGNQQTPESGQGSGYSITTVNQAPVQAPIRPNRLPIKRPRSSKSEHAVLIRDEFQIPRHEGAPLKRARLGSRDVGHGQAQGGHKHAASPPVSFSEETNLVRDEIRPPEVAAMVAVPSRGLERSFPTQSGVVYQESSGELRANEFSSSRRAGGIYVMSDSRLQNMNQGITTGSGVAEPHEEVHHGHLPVNYVVNTQTREPTDLMELEVPSDTDSEL
ncbi:hypothetical protein JX265_009499 [Neoarthrinium moseri]|uniref:Uncharacterized protein n=1 Tax=Neoarthrinium moseri TaxID=1658444 RepID=A0A9P9WG27_9PEZI|nr:hypothetical protein JX265_009499 [Neoarthrinium moseri]